MTDHTPEPWFKRERLGQLGTFYLGTAGVGWNLADRVVADCLTEKDADRILAMLNACAGIPTEQLGDVKALVDALDCLLGYHKKAQAQTQLGSGSQQAVSKAAAALAPFQED